MPGPAIQDLLRGTGARLNNVFDERKPQLSPLYKDLPNAHVDEFGTITELPSWNTAKRRILTADDMWCETCNKITKHTKRVCDACGTQFSFGGTKGIVK